jgi:hypothetical protein
MTRPQLFVVAIVSQLLLDVIIAFRFDRKKCGVTTSVFIGPLPFGDKTAEYREAIDVVGKVPSLHALRHSVDVLKAVDLPNVYTSTLSRVSGH